MCLPESECIARRGILGGPCAQGYGVCCVCMWHWISNYKNHINEIDIFISVMASCGDIVRENGTYFVNPNHPNQVSIWVGTTADH